MRPVGFEPTISASERSQTYALDLVSTGTGNTEQIFKENEVLSERKRSRPKSHKDRSVNAVQEDYGRSMLEKQY